MKVTTKITGAKEMERLLRQLPPAVAKKVMQAAFRKGANVIRDEARARAPIGRDPPARQLAKYGRLVDNIAVSVTKTGRTALSMVIHTGRAFWAIFDEFGTAPHPITPRRRKGLLVNAAGVVFGSEVSHPGQPAKPFMRPAFDNAAGRAVEVIGAELGKGIEKEALILAGPYAKARRSFGLR